MTLNACVYCQIGTQYKISEVKTLSIRIGLTGGLVPRSMALPFATVWPIIAVYAVSIVGLHSSISALYIICSLIGSIIVVSVLL